jgi:hypothetical protein
MKRKLVLVIAMTFFAVLLAIAEDVGAFSKLDLVSDGFIYKGIKFDQLYIYSGQQNINLHYSAKDFTEISYYQSGNETIIFLKGKDEAFDIPLSSISVISQQKKMLGIRLH